MLDSQFFDILKFHRCGEYVIGDYLVTVLNDKNSAVFHRIVEVGKSDYVLNLIGSVHLAISSRIKIYEPSDQYRSRVSKQTVITTHSRGVGQCISKDTFNLILLNYA